MEHEDQPGGQSYRERRPVTALAGLVSSVWVQQVSPGARPYLHRNVPNGSVEVRCRLGQVPDLVGPLTGPLTEALAPGSTVVGLRFRPGAASGVLGIPVSELAGLVLGAEHVWGRAAVAIGERLAVSAGPDAALASLQEAVAGRLAAPDDPDPVVAEAVRRLMRARVGAVGASLWMSECHFRRRFLSAVGVPPKALQRMLRFQGFLARVQFTLARGGGPVGLAQMAADCGYADQAAFRLDWPRSHAARVIAAWQAWAPAGPDELAASLLLTAPADPVRHVTVTVHGAMIGSEADAGPLLARLTARVGADPAAGSLTQLPFREAKRHLTATHPAEDRPAAHAFSKSEFFARPLPDPAIAELAGILEQGRAAGESRELDFTPWGGAYGRVRADATAFAHRDGLFLLKHSVAIDPTAGAAPRSAARGWLARSWASVHPFGTGGVYPNFPDPDLRDPARAYYGGNHPRLRRVKARYDPGDFFRWSAPANPHTRLP